MITTVAVTGSTNADLLDAARAGAPEGTWLRAERQTRGRGRLDRTWESSGGNLHASTIVRLRAGDPAAPGLALVAGVAVWEVAAAYAPGVPLRLKWPNDLTASGAKLGGILLERAGDAVVVGIGINLASRPAGLDRAVTHLAALAGGAPNPAVLLVNLAEAFARWLVRWRSEGLEPVRRRWLEVGSPLGAAVAVTGPDGRIEGLFDGLEPDGALRLRLADGRLEVVRAGDVALL